MSEAGGPLAGRGWPERRGGERALTRRFGAWFGWWVLLTAFWVGLDYSLDLAELLVGAAVAAVAALLVELVSHQADLHFRMRARWLVPALALPGRVLRDTAVVFAALFRRVLFGVEPDGGFVEFPAEWGDESALGVTRRVLLVGGRSVAPNTIALGLDRERGTVVVHQLARGKGGTP